MTYDSKCEDLAKYFLDEEDISNEKIRQKQEALQRLSEAIQQTIEEFIKFDLPLIIKRG
jgi:hypothetical protein